jgi:hypothetical protein
MSRFQNREFPSLKQGILRAEQGLAGTRSVTVQFSHACMAQADRDLTSTAMNAEEGSSVEMASGLPGGA